MEKVFDVFGCRLWSKGGVRQNVAPHECYKLIGGNVPGSDLVNPAFAFLHRRVGGVDIASFLSLEV